MENPRPETLDAADLDTLKFMLAQSSQRQQAAFAAQGAVALFKQHLAEKYHMLEGDGTDLATGAITRIAHPASDPHEAPRALKPAPS